MNSIDKESKDLAKRLEMEKRQNSALAGQIDEADQKLAAIATDLSATANKLNLAQGSLKAARQQAQFLKHEETRLASDHRTFSDPVWNVWTEPFSSDRILFAPQKLQPERDYSLVINLAALSYDEDKFAKDAGVYSQRADSSFMEWVGKHPELEARDVQILVIPDRRYFERQLDGQVMRPFPVELAKMRRVRSNGFTLTGSALKYLKSKSGNADFSFGIKSFHIKTSSTLGLASIAVSIWADGMPVNEISYSVCIVRELTDACDYPKQAVYTLKGVDLSKLDRPPDAALQIIDRQTDVVGVFRCNVCGWRSDEYRVWRVAETEKDFADEVKKIVRRLGKVPKLPSTQEYEQRFEAASDALYRVLFGSPPANSAADENQQRATAGLAAFNEFVTRSRDKVLANAPPLSLFVRLIPSEPDLVLTPIALMKIQPSSAVASPLAPSPTNTQGLFPDFVGFYVDVQEPLEYQNYSHSSSCLSQWVLLVPPPQAPDGADYQDVEDARAPFENWINTFLATCGDCVKQDTGLKGFRTWLGGSGKHAGAVLTLSHHDDAYGLYFDSSTQDPAIITSDIGRTFDDPAVAILAACGTAEPGGADFISKFNSHKVYTVIATSSAVDGGMAGQFLSLLMENLLHGRDISDYSLSQARFEAVRTLSTKADSSNVKFGARALEFILAGNGSIRLCPPVETKSTSDAR